MGEVYIYLSQYPKALETLQQALAILQEVKDRKSEVLSSQVPLRYTWGLPARKKLKLKAELVVLSACDTGRGRITGDGVIGLSRALISAGVPSVILSLWSVPDAPTATLMTNFYQNLQKYPDKAQALRQAMLTTLQQHPDPKDWAAFTLIGEAE